MKEDKVAIVVVGYNRINSMNRLLDSLLHADYQNYDVPLIISLDNCGSLELYDFARGFEWPFGTKKVILHEKRLGLKNHIFSCCDLSQFYKAVIILEDDLYVGPVFYGYSVEAVHKYEECDNVAGIALMHNEMNGYVGLPFTPLQNGYCAFAMQETCTWGECFTWSMWHKFREWLVQNEDTYKKVDMPDIIKNWTRAWSKYHNAYLVDTDRYFIYPYISYSTVFNDAGEHGGIGSPDIQVNIIQGGKSFFFGDFDLLVKYDIYINNIDLYNKLKLSKTDLCLDLYGNNQNMKQSRYLLTVKKLHYKILNRYALQLRPQELNVFNSIDGNDILLYDTKHLISKKKGKKTIGINVINYHLRGFNKCYLVKYSFNYLIRGILRKLYIKNNLKNEYN
jgi:hypothetical protein